MAMQNFFVFLSQQGSFRILQTQPYQLTFTCSKLPTEKLEKSVKYVQS